MKKTVLAIALAAASTIGFATSASAQESNTSVGVNYNAFGYDRSDTPDFDIPSISLVGGYKFNQYMGVQASYGINAGSTKKDGVELSTDSHYGMALTGHIPVADAFSIDGKIGYNNVTLKGKVDGYSSTESDSSLGWGVGASYQATPDVKLSAGYEMLYNGDHVQIAGATIGAAYTF
ncbi:MAG: porin family protein [Thiotrichales bacterium]|nr:porin family protein [Thiotrichales bacterium]